MNSSIPDEHPTSLYALIVAGGSGARMKQNQPKQFLTIGGKPILLHTLEAFYRYSPELHIILTLPAAQIEHWKQLRKSFHCQVPHAIVEGGASRFQSVKNGLILVPSEALVAIHDGVRPFVSQEMISQAYECAGKYGNAITAVALKESIRRLGRKQSAPQEGIAQGEGSQAEEESSLSQAEDRNAFRLVQTPQTFQASLIKAAYRQKEKSHFTDCASVAEAAGHHIRLIDGSYQNIKITTPEDLLVAESLLKTLPDNKQAP